MRLEEKNFNSKAFKFEETWTKESEYEQPVEATWVRDGDALENIKRVKEVFLSSNLFIFRRSCDRPRELNDRLIRLQEKGPSQ